MSSRAAVHIMKDGTVQGSLCGLRGVAPGLLVFFSMKATCRKCLRLYHRFSDAGAAAERAVLEEILRTDPAAHCLDVAALALRLHARGVRVTRKARA